MLFKGKNSSNVFNNQLRIFFGYFNFPFVSQSKLHVHQVHVRRDNPYTREMKKSFILGKSLFFTST